MTILDLLENPIFSGVPSNAIWDAIKFIWQKATSKSWQELYLDAFELALSEMRPHLQARIGGEISFSRGELASALAQNFEIDKLELSKLNRTEFIRKLASIMAAKSVLVLERSELTETDYEQILRNLIRCAHARFKEVVLEREPIFRRALIEEVMENNALSREIIDYLSSQFGITQSELDAIKRAIADTAEKLAVILELVRGPSLPLTSFVNRIQSFLDEYLGTGSMSVPFAGRTQQLLELDSWLEDITAPPYSLLITEAGRGKSALLAHWAHSVTTRGLARVVFMPVSVRFNTATANVVFAALGTQLAAFYGETMPNGMLSPEEWRELSSTFLKRTPPEGKQLLVIIDGVDEATDWQIKADLFPVLPAPGVRAVVSARYLAGDVDDTGWRRRLGWQSRGLARNFFLPPLNRTGIEQVILSVLKHAERSTRQVELANEIFQLSEGDPLVVRLYVDQLIQKHLSTSVIELRDLSSIKPGLKGYFERWWEDQEQIWKAQGQDPLIEKKNTGVFLCICASALGPLSRDDIAAIAGNKLRSGLQIQAVAEVVSRFIIGNGREHGFVFSHPRLGQFFADQMTTEEMKFWEGRILEYCTRTLTSLKNDRRASAPSYVLQYYGAHLERAKSTDIYDLVSEPWLRAWENSTGTQAGFLNDVDRAWRLADELILNSIADKSKKALSQYERVDLMMQFKSSICVSSVTSLRGNLSPELLDLSLRFCVLTPAQAFVFSSQIADEQRRVKALIAIAPYLSQAWLKESLAMVRLLSREELQSEALVGLATHLPNEAMKDGLELVLSIENEALRARALSKLATCCSTEIINEIISNVMRIQDGYIRAKALLEIIPVTSSSLKQDLAQNVLDAARNIGELPRCVEVFSRLMPNTPDAYRQVNQDQIVTGVRKIIDSDPISLDILPCVYACLPDDLKAEITRNALEFWGRYIDCGGSHTTGLQMLSDTLPSQIPGMIGDECISFLQEVFTDEDALSQSLMIFSQRLPAEFNVKLLEIARQIVDHACRTRILIELTPNLPKELQSQVASETLTIARAVEEPEARASSLTGLLPLILEKERVEVELEVVQIVRHIPSEHTHLRLLSGLLPHVTKESKFSLSAEAVDLANALRFPDQRAESLTKLASLVDDRFVRKVVQDALAASEQIADHRARFGVMIALVPYFPSEMRHRALDAARGIKDDWLKADMIKAAVNHQGELQESEVKVALNVVRGIEDPSRKANAFISLIPRLPTTIRETIAVEFLPMAKLLSPFWFQLEALAMLLPYLPNKVRTESESSIVSQLTRYVKSWKDDEIESIMESLVKLIPNLSSELRSFAFRTVLAAVHTRQTVFWIDPLSELAPLMGNEITKETFAYVSTIRGETDRAKVIAGLYPHLFPNLKQLALENIVDLIQGIEGESGDYEIGQALAPLAMYLPEPTREALLKNTLAASLKISSELWRSRALAKLLKFLPESMKPEALDAAIDAAYRIDEEAWCVDCLKKLLPFMQTELQAATVKKILQMSLEPQSHNTDPPMSSKGLESYLWRWVHESPSDAYSFWKEILLKLSHNPRSSFLSKLEDIFPLALGLADGEATEITARAIYLAIEEVANWWP